MAVNCIHTDIQDRANGCDFDSDFFFVTNNEVMVKSAKAAYKQYPTIVNKLKESGLTYKNTMRNTLVWITNSPNHVLVLRIQ